jgi:peptide chain release factor 3
MNPAHRDRIVFMRICSGKFERGMPVHHVQSGKIIKLSQPQQFLAQERTIVDEAFPGDIIGLFDPGTFGVGDTLCQPGKQFRFQDFPVFPPEHFARVQAKDTMKRKQFVKGMTQLAQEGAVQIFRQPYVIESFIVGAVGSLQFDVLEYRLKQEYGVDLLMHHLPYSVARWLEGEGLDLKTLKGLDNGMLVEDIKERPLVLISNEWQLNWARERNPNVEFLASPSEQPLS